MKVFKCPICKSEPMFKIYSLDRGNGHGYPGHHNYEYYCDKCKLLSSGCNTIYTPLEKVHNEAIRNWNTRVNAMRIIMGKKELPY
jgi:hypothetical protein